MFGLSLITALALRSVTVPFAAVSHSVSPPITGVVQESAGQPLANARVFLVGQNRVALTGAAGTFSFSGLPAGQYHVSVALIGYAPAHADVSVSAQGTDAVKVTVTMRPSVLQLGTIEVTGTPLNTDPRQVTQATVDVTAQVLAREIRPTVALTLQNQPGVATRFNGPAATAPVIRGLQGERILVLQDGDRAGDLSSSAPDHSVSIDPLIAHPIQVI